MGMCNDDVTKHLKKFQYNTIYPPRANSSPLEVLARKKDNLTSWGALDDIFSSSLPLPAIYEDNHAMDIQGNITSKHEFKIGITILGSIISAVGGNLGIRAAYKGAESVQFQYEDVTRYYIKPVQLDAFVSQGEPRDGLVTTSELLEADKLYVFTAVIKARKIVVEATNSNGSSLAVDIPVIKEIVGGNIEIAPENSANTKVSYMGQVPAGFGFKAVKIDQDSGKFYLKPVLSGAITAASVDDEPDNEYEVKVFEKPYVQL